MKRIKDCIKTWCKELKDNITGMIEESRIFMICSYVKRKGKIKNFFKIINKAFNKIVGKIGDHLEKILRRLPNTISRLIVMGIILNVVNQYYPELSTRFPTIYGWFDGWLQFGEFLYKVTIKGTYSILTLNCSEFCSKVSVEIKGIVQQLVNWASTIKF